MPPVIAWCGFLGAWLLVAGPLDQAVREVEDNEFGQDAITEAASRVAVEETWELHESYEWPDWVYVAMT
jgi:hypothetical protein